MTYEYHKEVTDVAGISDQKDFNEIWGNYEICGEK